MTIDQREQTVPQEQESRLKMTDFGPVTPEDYPTLLNWFQHGAIREHFAFVPKTLEDLANFYETHDQHGYAARNARGEILGALTLRDNLSSIRRNGYVERVAVGPEYQGKGIGTQMMAAAINHAFSQEGHNYYKLTLAVVPDIETWERTYHVYKKLGFKDGAVWRNHVVIEAGLVEPGATPADGAILRMLSDGSQEQLIVKDAIWMDLMRSEWESDQWKTTR